MDYYRCTNTELRQEIVRRGYEPYGGQDRLSEGLKKDDDARGSEATTVETVLKANVSCKGTLMRTAEFGKTVPANLLVGERIVHWTMNTFFPTLHLFFESGLSCTIEGGQLPDAVVGLDSALRFRLTDITREEDGRLVKTILPEKLVGPEPSIGILEAVVGRRTSIAVKHKPPEDKTVRLATIVQETHVVVGLRLEGMERMGYVWARVPTASAGIDKRTWGDVRIAGLRDDVPTPFLGFPQVFTKPGGEAVVVEKESMIDDGTKTEGFDRR